MAGKGQPTPPTSCNGRPDGPNPVESRTEYPPDQAAASCVHPVVPRQVPDFCGGIGQWAGARGADGVPMSSGTCSRRGPERPGSGLGSHRSGGACQNPCRATQRATVAPSVWGAVSPSGRAWAHRALQCVKHYAQRSPSFGRAWRRGHHIADRVRAAAARSFRRQ